jgi:hypothetical protein
VAHLGEMVVRTDGDADPAIGATVGVIPVDGCEFRYT